MVVGVAVAGRDAGFVDDAAPAVATALEGDAVVMEVAEPAIARARRAGGAVNDAEPEGSAAEYVAAAIVAAVTVAEPGTHRGGGVAAMEVVQVQTMVEPYP